MTPQETYGCLSSPIFLEEEVRQKYVGGSKIAIVFYVRIPSERTAGAALFSCLPSRPHMEIPWNL